MTRGLLCLALGGLVLAACGEREESLPTSPSFKPTVPPTVACDFDAVKSLVGSYFQPPDQQTAQGYVSAMEAATKWEPAAVENGFKIMDLIGKASRSYAPSPTVGSNVTKAVTKCMFDASQAEYTSLANGAGLNALEFDKALIPAQGGVYYVVGAGYDINNIPAVPQTLSGKVSNFGKLSAVGPGPVTFTSPGPNPSFTLGNWTAAMSVNTANNQGGRALIYGYPVSYGPALTSPIVFEWAAIAPSTAFQDVGIVSICDGQTAENLMVHESSIGVLAYTEANLCGLPDASGTTKTGFRSQFTNTPVAALSLEWVNKPNFPLKVNSVATFVARATTTVTVAGQTTTEGVNNVCLTVTGTNNNGQGTMLVNVGGVECPGQTNNTDNVVTAVTQTDPAHGLKAGYATFTYKVTKSGNLITTLKSNGVPNRQIGSATPVELRYNVKP